LEVAGRWNFIQKFFGQKASNTREFRTAGWALVEFLVANLTKEMAVEALEDRRVVWYGETDLTFHIIFQVLD
jgi:hypothetical protein